MEKNVDAPAAEQRHASCSSESLTAEEKAELLKALESARENVRPTVKRLLDSESVSTELLGMRLEAVR